MRTVMIRALAVALAVLSPAILPGGAAAQTEGTAFVGGFDDLPLMAGLEEIEGAGVTFDTPSGRIVERYATGDVAAAAVERFYRETLPALGWQPAGGLAFRREGEALTIAVFPPAVDRHLVVRFSLAPA